MIRSLFFPVTICLGLTLAGTLFAKEPQTVGKTEVKGRKIRAKDIFRPRETIMFQDDFRAGSLDRWQFSENDQYRLAAANPERIQLVDAPGLPEGSKAVRFVVNRAPNSFRSEISLPHEEGFQERWYGERVLIPEEWVFDPSKAVDIVMQWHGIPGNWKATYPNLEISVGNDRWWIKQSVGSPQAGPIRTSQKLDAPVRRGVWVSWVIHAKWSPNEDGLLQIWKDGELVFDRKGPNVYGTIGVEYTPYLKTGIYHPEWHTNNDRKREAFDKEKPVATKKIVYITDFKMGNEKAKYEDVAPESSTE